jgi:hypothetical protein
VLVVDERDVADFLSVKPLRSLVGDAAEAKVNHD